MSTFNMSSLQDQSVEQFIHLSLALKRESGDFFDAKIISTHPPNIKMNLHLWNMESLLDECTMSLFEEGASYRVDKAKTLYVHVESLITLQIMIQTLHKFIINNYATGDEVNQYVQKFTDTKKYQVHLAT